MKKITILLFTFIITLQLYGQQKPASVFISAGQSNADGRAYIGEGLPDYMKGGYNFLHFANVTSTEHTDFYPRVFNSASEGGRFAFSDVANYWIEQALKADFYSVKCAYGGTAIALGQTVEKLPFWNAGTAYIDTARAYRGTVGNGTSLAKSLTEGFRVLADSVLSRLAQGYDVKAIMWHQGESDRKAGSAYYGNLKDLINYLRQEIYKVTGDDADLALPFIMGTVSHGSTQFNSTVESAQYQLAKDMENVYVIDLSDAGLRSDKLHFDAEWTEYFGKRVYNQLVEIGAVDGQKIEIVKPDGDVVTEKVDLKPVNHWNFASSNWSEASVTAMQSYTTLNSGYGYRNKTAMTNAGLAFGDYVFPETQGLLFTVTRDSRLGLYPAKNAICFVSSEARVIVPGVKPGQFIYVKASTAKAGTQRGIVVTGSAKANLDVIAGDTTSTSTVESVYWVQDSYTTPVDAEFTASGGVCYLYEIMVTDTDPRNNIRMLKPLATPATGLTTYCATKDLDFSTAKTDSLEAYKATLSADGTSVVLTRVMQVAKGEAVLLRTLNGEATAAHDSVLVTEGLSCLEDNALVGVLDTKTIQPTMLVDGVEYSHLVLDEAGQFVKLTAETTLQAREAYLSLPTSQLGSITELPLFFSPATTVRAMAQSVDSSDRAFYNIAGQRVTKDYKGLVVVSGQKRIVR
ncbi:MAG: hypothetical protein I3J02_04185 [Prevotella sp.]|nr:hypothetical protein [Prevotella sp.]